LAATCQNTGGQRNQLVEAGDYTMDIKSVLSNMQKPGDYTPPIGLSELGLLCFEAGITPEGHWPPTMRSAWFQRMRAARAEAWRMGWGEGSAYLISQGAEVSI
jgi:hypothetical protein